jgi:hypothetical protein
LQKSDAPGQYLHITHEDLNLSSLEKQQVWVKFLNGLAVVGGMECRASWRRECGG